MKPAKMVALILVIAGAGLAYWGYHESQAVSNKLARSLTGETDTTVVVLYIGAILCVGAGLFGLTKR